MAGALATGARGRVSPRLLVVAAAAFGVPQLAAAAAPTLTLQVVALVPLGAASVTFAAGVNSSLQLAAPPELRGRIMALYSVVFIGSTPIGAPLVGWLAEVAGPRAGLVLGGIAALAAAAGARVALQRPTLDHVGRHRSPERFSSSVRARRELGSVESPNLHGGPAHRRPQKEQRQCLPPRSPSSA